MMMEQYNGSFHIFLPLIALPGQLDQLHHDSSVTPPDTRPGPPGTVVPCMWSTNSPTHIKCQHFTPDSVRFVL